MATGQQVGFAEASQEAQALQAGLRDVSQAWHAQWSADESRRSPDLAQFDVMDRLIVEGWVDAAGELLAATGEESWLSLHMWEELGEIGALGAWPHLVGFVRPLCHRLSHLGERALLDLPPLAVTAPLPDVSATKPDAVTASSCTTDAVTNLHSGAMTLPWWDGVEYVLLPCNLPAGQFGLLVGVDELHAAGFITARPASANRSVSLVTVEGDVPEARLARPPLSAASFGPATAWARLVLHRLLDARCVGAARRALGLTLDHVTTREQFGRPIGSFQALKHRVAWMGARSRASGLVLERVLRDGPPMESVLTQSLTARSFIHHQTLRVCEDAMHCHGGQGVTWESDLHLLYRSVVESDLFFSPIAVVDQALGQDLVDLL